jgi:hypothetical protein
MSKNLNLFKLVLVQKLLIMFSRKLKRTLENLPIKI